jgi:hypothetical protein
VCWDTIPKDFDVGHLNRENMLAPFCVGAAGEEWPQMSTRATDLLMARINARGLFVKGHFFNASGRTGKDDGTRF